MAYFFSQARNPLWFEQDVTPELMQTFKPKIHQFLVLSWQKLNAVMTFGGVAFGKWLGWIRSLGYSPLLINPGRFVRDHTDIDMDTDTHRELLPCVPCATSARPAKNVLASLIHGAYPFLDFELPQPRAKVNFCSL